MERRATQGSRRNAYREAAQASDDFPGTLSLTSTGRGATLKAQNYDKGQFKALQRLRNSRYSTDSSLKSNCLIRCLSNE